MALVRCIVRGCKESVREGLVRPSYDPTRQLADGNRCWRCRRRAERESASSRRVRKGTP
jgi:hypothetical protein